MDPISHKFGDNAVNRPQPKTDVLDMLKGTKHSKSEENYRPGNNEKKVCHTCKFYEEPSQDKSPCSKVIGIVESSATCDLWAGGDGPSEGPAPKPPEPQFQSSPGHTVMLKIHTGTGANTVTRTLNEKL